MFILLNSIEKISGFVRMIDRYPSELVLVSDERKINAKSLLGIFSLDLTKPIKVETTNACEKNQISDILMRYALK